MNPESRPRRPIRRRIAASFLLIAPLAQLGADAADAFGGRDAKLSFVALTLVAWIPALQALEHFLKRRAELASLVASGLGFVGLLASAANAMSGEVRSDDAPHSIVRAATSLFSIALVSFGAGYFRFGIGPLAAAFALCFGALLSLAAPFVANASIGVLGHVLVLAACSAIALRILAKPSAWSDGEL